MNRLFLILIVLLIACSGEQQKNESSKKESDTVSEGEGLVGKWQNLEIIVRMPDSILQVHDTLWQRRLGIKPIITAFNSDRTFHSEYRSPEDSLIMKSTGTWDVTGDTLSMIEHGIENKYHFLITGDTVFFRGYLDWDQDGEANDHYAGKQLKLKEN